MNKGRQLRGRNPQELTDDDLDIQVGSLQQTLERVDAEITAVENTLERLRNERLALINEVGDARLERNVRNGRGRGRN